MEMTLRDQFAETALRELIRFSGVQYISKESEITYIAEQSYKLADAMLNARLPKAKTSALGSNI